MMIAFVMVISLSSCNYSHDLYDDISDYHKCFDCAEYLGTSGVYLILPRIENEHWDDILQDAFVQFGYDPKNNNVIPPNIGNLNVIDFFCEETTWFVGSTNIEFMLSIKYDQASFNNEINRLSAIVGKEKIVYDTQNFIYPAYVSILGHHKTNQYVLIDEENSTLHYIYLQFCLKEDLKKIPEDFLPFGYYEGGIVKDISYSIFG